MATYGEQVRITGLVATGDLSTHQYKPVVLGSTAGTVKVATAATDKIIGILQNKPTDGQAADVCVLGESKAVMAASVTLGLYLTANSTGLVNTTTAGQTIVAQALETSSATAGEIRRVLLSGIFRY